MLGVSRLKPPTNDKTKERFQSGIWQAMVAATSVRDPRPRETRNLKMWWNAWKRQGNYVKLRQDMASLGYTMVTCSSCSLCVFPSQILFGTSWILRSMDSSCTFVINPGISWVVRLHVMISYVSKAVGKQNFRVTDDWNSNNNTCATMQLILGSGDSGKWWLREVVTLGSGDLGYLGKPGSINHHCREGMT